jgi:hypothetical protein
MHGFHIHPFMMPERQLAVSEALLVSLILIGIQGGASLMGSAGVNTSGCNRQARGPLPGAAGQECSEC